jgi:uncharacterized protein YqgC (DUF456 family)
MTWLQLLAVLLVVAGFAGLILPALPGLALIFGGLWLLAWTDGYAHVGMGTLIVLGVLAVTGLAIDFIAGLLGAKVAGASRTALAGAGIGAVLGLFLGIPGLILGPLIGAALGELIARQNLARAATVGVAAGLGFVVALVLKAGIALAMVSIFAAVWLLH